MPDAPDSSNPPKADGATDRHASGCLICGGELVYGDTASLRPCALCAKEVETTVACEDGHFICDDCHRLPANDRIEAICLESEWIDPVALAAALMNNDRVTMHGPEHHFLVPAVLLTTVHNLNSELAKKALHLREARVRAEQIPGGACGLHGACGAGIGVGIFVAVYTGAKPVSTVDWGRANLASARALEEIAIHGGPRCCKRDTYLAILSAAAYIDEVLDIRLPVTRKPVCTFMGQNKECRGAGCPFHPSAVEARV